MTLPYERKNAVMRTAEFLKDLMDPKKTPRVPKEIRKKAYSCLRHYPLKYEMERASELAPEVFGDTPCKECGMIGFHKMSCTTGYKQNEQRHMVD